MPLRPHERFAKAHYSATNSVLNAERRFIMAEIKITVDNFEQEVIQSEQPVLVDFWAAWCGPCRMLAPAVAQIAAECEGKIKVGKVNVDEEPELAQRFGIMSIPTVLAFKDGKKVNQSIGLVPKDKLLALFD